MVGILSREKHQLLYVQSEVLIDMHVSSCDLIGTDVQLILLQKDRLPSCSVVTLYTLLGGPGPIVTAEMTKA